MGAGLQTKPFEPSELRLGSTPESTSKSTAAEPKTSPGSSSPRSFVLYPASPTPQPPAKVTPKPEPQTVDTPTGPTAKYWALGMHQVHKASKKRSRPMSSLPYGPVRKRRRGRKPGPKFPKGAADEWSIMNRWKPMALRKMTGRVPYQLPLMWGNKLKEKIMSYRKYDRRG